MKKFVCGIILLVLAAIFDVSVAFCQRSEYANAFSGKPDKELEQKLRTLIDSFHGIAGVYVLNVKTRQEAAVNADTVFPTASIVKVPILVGIFKKIQEGELSYHQPLVYRDSMAHGGSGLMQYFKDSTKIDLSKTINLMLSHSDNTAALWCQSLAGGGAAINEWLASHNFRYTRVNSHTPGRSSNYDQYGWGQTTPREMADLLLMIRKNKIVNAAASERMYRDMTRTYWNNYALSAIPPYVQTASKQGMVNASRSELVMVTAPHGDYVFYIATKNNKDQRWTPDNEGWQLARKVSGLLWHYFEPENSWKPAKGYKTYWDWND